MPAKTQSNETQRPQAGARPTTELAVSGMSCANCARHVLEALRAVPGVHDATVSLEARRATVYWDSPAALDIAAAQLAVGEAGYGARVLDPHTHDHGASRLAGWQLNLWIAVPGTALLMLGEWAFGWGMAGWFRWLAFAVAGLVQVLAGARFYRGAWGQLKAGSSNMDTLVALGSTTAFAYSVWALFSGQGGHLYFMEAAAIITLISLGHWVESLVGVRASSALRQLLDLAPAVARRRSPDGSESEVPVAALQAGDQVPLRPGDRVPTDGEVLDGSSAVDESMLTGESAPVDKTVGSELYAGTVNLNGRLLMRVTATGEATALAHIITAVQRAQTSRANIQRLGDRVSSVFVPVVVAVALAAGIWWGLAPASARQVHAWVAQFAWVAQPPAGHLAAAFIIAAAVLIIACPCAMGLATPAAIMAGSNAAAQRGILIRDGVALEKAGQVTAVVFDKTGTLTVGKPSVVKVWGNGADETAAISLAAALAQHSTHPISLAVARLAAAEVALADWQEVHGAGVEATVHSPQSTVHSPRLSDGSDQSDLSDQSDSSDIPSCPTHHAPRSTLHAPRPTARLGSLRWLRESDVDLTPGQTFIADWSAQGATIIGLALDQSLAALFAVKDTVKSGARAVLEQLERQGLRTYLVTGDNPLTAASIARQAGIDPARVFAEVRPEQKAAFVKDLQAQGERVAFVGDGINDAPALEQADLGIAVSRASDIAREAADIILLKSEIEAVPESLGLARATLRTIKQNLFWAFFYNAASIPLAALGFMSPILCAAAMGLSDLVVLGNALRLRRWRL